MTRQRINIHQIAKLTALAIVLNMFEFFLPSPIYGVKPGIANIIILFAFVKFNFQSAVYISLIRVFVSSLLLGTFLTPSFFLSLFGALISLLFLYFCKFLSKNLFSLFSFSILSALGHIIGQFIIVRIFIIPDNGIFYLLPIFLLFGFIFSLINAYVLTKVITSSN
jgi:heptaprenyl diphosphate synthase